MGEGHRLPLGARRETHGNPMAPMAQIATGINLGGISGESGKRSGSLRDSPVLQA